MSTFRLYLWKEWREQRAAVVALAGMLPVLVLAITFGMKARQVGVPYFASASGVVALGVTLLAIGGELLSSDRRRGGQWLERLPAGLSGAFPAKLVVLVLSSVLALGYGFALASLGAFLRGRPVHSPLDLANEAPGLALIVLGAAALLVAWTFAASAWCGRGTIALLVGGLVFGGVALVVRHFAVLEYSPSALEVAVVLALLVTSGLVSAWVAFTRGQRFGGSLLAAATRGVPSGALCLLPVGGWAAFQLHDRDVFDLASPDCRVYSAWVFGDGRSALLCVIREDERWYRLPSHVVRCDFESGAHETIGGPGADFTLVYEDTDREPTQEPNQAYIFDVESDETIAVLDASTAEACTVDVSLGSFSDWERAGHGFLVGNTNAAELLDPYHGLRVRPQDIGIDSWEVYIGPHTWLVETWPQWLEYSPDCAELVTADWMDPTAEAGPMLADGRLLVRLPDEGLFALADPARRVLVRLPGAEVGEFWPHFLQGGGLHPGEPAFVNAQTGRYRLDEERMELVPCDDSYAGELLRWLPDGSLFSLMEDGLYRRAPSGERTCVFSFAKAEVTP